MSAYNSKIESEHEKEVTKIGSSSQAYLSSSNPKVANLLNKEASSAIFSNPSRGIPTSTNDVVPLLSTTTNHDDQVEIAKRNQKKSHQRTYLAQTLKLARNGDSISQFNISLIYFFGNGESQNYPKALIWFGKAANHGDVEAQFNLGLMYKLGGGVEQKSES